MFKKFLYAGFSSVLMGFIGLFVLQRHKIQEIYKGTEQFQDAIAILRSHEAALKYLGEPIEDGYLKVTNADSNNGKTVYEVKVRVSGSKSKGVLYFWVLGDSKDPIDFNISRIELQIDEMKQRMLIKNNDL